MNLCQAQAVDKLVLKASEMFDIQPSTIKGKSKKETYCIARGLIWVVCIKEMYLTFRDIGAYFSNRDGKTIHSGYVQMRNEIEISEERQEHYKTLVNG